MRVFFGISLLIAAIPSFADHAPPFQDGNLFEAVALYSVVLSAPKIAAVCETQNPGYAKSFQNRFSHWQRVHRNEIVAARQRLTDEGTKHGTDPLKELEAKMSDYVRDLPRRSNREIQGVCAQNLQATKID